MLLGQGRGLSVQPVQLLQRSSAVLHLIQRRTQSSERTLSGRNIFQLRAATAVEAITTGAAHDEADMTLDLPSSDESDKLLRVRHSVSGLADMWGHAWAGESGQNYINTLNCFRLLEPEKLSCVWGSLF